MNQVNSLGLIVLGLFLAIGLVGGGYFIGQTMYNAKVALNTAEAKGLAERRVKSDWADWSVQYSVVASDNSDIAGLYKRAEEDQKSIIDLLQESGFEDGEIEIGVIDYRYQEYRDDDQNLVDEKHILNGSISVGTSKVELVSKARATANTLIAKGVNIENRNPSYRFTKLNDIKPEMLRDAAKNARIAASEFAENAGAKVGRIRSARQGGFIIRDAGEDYGDTAKIEKDVRVVTTISFYLED